MSKTGRVIKMPHEGYYIRDFVDNFYRIEMLASSWGSVTIYFDDGYMDVSESYMNRMKCMSPEEIKKDLLMIHSNDNVISIFK